MNEAELFRLRLQSLVARGLASSEVAARAGLGAASEVWGGETPRERPAWYLWLRGRPGAWQLELAGAETRDHAAGSATVGRFTVRHYPSAGSPALERFSEEERRIVAGALDATHTPRIELASRIPEALFTVGSIEWALDRHGDGAVLALATLDRLRTRTERGEVVRDVPGWLLAFPIFSLLAGLHAQVEQCAATRLVVSRQGGFDVVLGSGAPECRDVTDTAQGEVLVAFPRPGEGPERAEQLLDVLRDPSAETVTDATFPIGAHPPHELAADPRLPVAVSHAWFGGDVHAEDGIACAC